MAINIHEKKEFPLLSRTVITASLDYTGTTPSNSDIKNQLASSLKAGQNLIVVKNIRTGFGSHKAKVTAYLYDSEENLNRVEPRLHRKQLEKLKKQQEAEKKASEAKASE